MSLKNSDCHCKKKQNSQETTMIISDISHLEITSDDNSVVGGTAYSNAYASASAYGRYYSDTSTSTYTSASSGYPYYYYYYPYSNSYANSGSHSYAN
jgi:hypothetical protein